jgi:hypothetical protein
MKEDFIDDDDDDNNNNNHMAFMEMGCLLTCFGLTYLEESLMVSPGFFCLLVCTFLVLSEIYYGTVCLYVASSFFCSAIFCPKLGLYLVLLKSLYLFYNLFGRL